MSPSSRNLPECWGHRGASAAFPENTLASFERAVRDGAEGIESGKIKDRVWYGPDGMEHLRTRREPKQPIPTFAETVAFLMQPENRHVSFNIDIKPQDNAKHMFTLMSEIITVQPDWQTALAPRILLGLWHSSYLPLAKEILPYCRRSHLGVSVKIAREYFWDDCDTFSIAMCALSNREGQKFLAECKQHGKRVMVWTVNNPDEMVEACRWGVDVILTDVTKTWLELRKSLEADFEQVSAKHGRRFLWTNPLFWSPVIGTLHYVSNYYFTRVVGPWEQATIL
ncbi:glycerophosphodiester phosphodiesterase [Moniliophthora roreri MCA 2997]|uniref:Glycerophosphodiester phosphodiesterase n=1 Tax=Moniliophthora roreri (strain MCA 2997) TaxID=1381753 RepID=V2YUN7_MONRO|nr:glycerophosphodiester phosphodiesterase [Moniliophthora roreri MCA 2997]